MRVLAVRGLTIAALLGALLGLARADANEIAAQVTDDRGQPLADAVVVAVPVDGALRPTTRPRDGVIDQVDKEFTPRVSAILVGTSVHFPNHDNVRHQVYSFSPGKRFELPLYAGVPSQPVLFDKPGVIVLGCNIHDWMVAYVYVSESPYFAKTGADGRALITDLPSRAYFVRVWHPQAEAAEATTQKTIDASRAARSSVAWSLKVRPETHVRRAPTAGGGARY